MKKNGSLLRPFQSHSVLSIKLIKKTLCETLEEDYVDLGWIYGVVRSATNITNKKKLKNKTLEVIEEMLNEDLIFPGDLAAEGTFESWGLGDHRWLNRIKMEWSKAKDDVPSFSIWFNFGRKCHEFAKIQVSDTEIRDLLLYELSDSSLELSWIRRKIARELNVVENKLSKDAFVAVVSKLLRELGL